MRGAFLIPLVALGCGVSSKDQPTHGEQSGVSLLIQAEDFTSHVDNTPGNADLVYRTDVDADINYDHDPFYYEGIRVLNITKGESLSYVIELPTADVWDITFNGVLNFDLYFDGQRVASDQGVPVDFVVEDHLSNQDVVVSGVELAGGVHEMKIVANNGVNDTNGMHLDYVRFASVTQPPPPLPAPTKPYDDSESPERPTDYVSPVERYGELYVDGSQIKSKTTGKAVQLRGAALHSSKWFPTVPNSTVYNMAYHEGVQVIRLAVYAEWGTYDDPEMQAYLERKTLEVVREAIDIGVYLEISFHIHQTSFEIGGKEYELERAFYAWLLSQPEVVTGPDNLIFGIVNEVASDTVGWETVRPYAQAFVDQIRRSHPKNLILSGTPYWCQRPDEAASNPLAGDNIVYTFHMYAAGHSLSVANALVEAHDQGLPLWANEISPGHYDWSMWQYDFDRFDQLLAMLDERKISWTAWVWSVKGEALSVLKWDSPFQGPWKEDDFTEGGRYLRSKFRGSVPTPTLLGTER